MTCRNFIHRLDVTLWGWQLETGCSIGLALRYGCNGLALIQLAKAKEVQA